MPLAREPAHDCSGTERYLVVIDAGGPGAVTPPTDPALAACDPEPRPVYTSEIGKIVRCTA